LTFTRRAHRADPGKVHAGQHRRAGGDWAGDPRRDSAHPAVVPRVGEPSHQLVDEPTDRLVVRRRCYPTKQHEQRAGLDLTTAHTAGSGRVLNGCITALPGKPTPTGRTVSGGPVTYRAT